MDETLEAVWSWHPSEHNTAGLTKSGAYAARKPPTDGSHGVEKKQTGRTVTSVVMPDRVKFLDPMKISSTGQKCKEWIQYIMIMAATPARISNFHYSTDSVWAESRCLPLRSFHSSGREY